MAQNFRVNPNRVIPKPGYGAALGLSYAQPKSTLPLNPSPGYHYVQHTTYTDVYAITGTDVFGNPVWQKVNSFK